MYNLPSLSTCTTLCSHHPYSQDFPITPNGNSAPLHPVPGNCLSATVSTDLPIPDSLYKWNHTLCDLLCLAYFSQHDVFRVHTYCSMLSVLHSLIMAEWYSFVWLAHILFIHSSTEGHLVCFHLLAVENGEHWHTTICLNSSFQFF